MANTYKDLPVVATPVGGSNSFETIVPPYGTSPVAESSTDTLTLGSSDDSVIITGNSTTDTIDFKITSNVGSIFKQTNTVTVGGTTTEGSISGTGVGSLTLPANFFSVGRTLEISGFGYHSGVSNPGLRIRFKLGSTVILDSGVRISHNDTNGLFTLKALCTCRTIGATGTVMSQGIHIEATDPSTISFGLVNLTPTTLDTTVSQVLSITAQWDNANAGNTISLTNLLVKG